MTVDVQINEVNEKAEAELLRIEQEYKENGTFMKVRLASEQLEDFEKFII